MPSMVTIFASPTEPAGTEQERVATPSISTVQAPHCATPQPYLVPVRPTHSRIAQSSGVSGGPSTSRVVPLIFSRAMSGLLASACHFEPVQFFFDHVEHVVADF